VCKEAGRSVRRVRCAYIRTARQRAFYPTRRTRRIRAGGPLQVHYTLPADVLLPGRYAPRVGWWDAERGVWDEAGINEVVLERREPGGERVVRLSTQRLTALALLQVCFPAVATSSKDTT
jgi:hypothetical protein